MKNKNAFFIASCFLLPLLGFAGSSSVQDLGAVAGNITGSLGGIATLIVSIATVAGLVFGVAAIFKFKQHRDNPTQVTLGQPLSLLAIAVFLLWLQFLLQSAGKTVTGNDSTDDGQGKVGGTPGWLIDDSGSKK